MNSRNRMACLAILTMSVSLVALSPAEAQVPPWDPSYQAPRTELGQPDLQGNWSNVTLTPFERPDGREPVYSWDEVRGIEQPEDLA